MAIDPTMPPSGDDFINLAAFPGFQPFVHPLQGASPPEPLEDSPESNPVPGGDDNLDDDEDDGDLFDGSAHLGKHGNSAGASGASKRNKASSAERRATHNAIERARRESLNGRFMELASALPNMANVKRPSKSVIVTRSLDFVYSAQMRERALVLENNTLRAELNQLRARLSIAPLPPPAPLPMAGDYTHRHFKDAGQGNVAASLTASNPPLPVPSPDYFAASSAMGMGALAAHCHPAQFGSGFAGTPGVPPPLSAPANMLTFSGPFQHPFGAGFADGTSPPMTARSHQAQGVAQPSSPASKSENDRPNSAPNIGVVAARPLTTPSDGSAAPMSAAGSVGSSGPHSFNPSSFEDVVASAASTGSFAALHAARLQQQAHFLAANAPAGTAAGCADGPPVTSGPWGLTNAFAQSAPYMF